MNQILTERLLGKMLTLAVNFLKKEAVGYEGENRMNNTWY